MWDPLFGENGITFIGIESGRPLAMVFGFILA